ncbi:MAG TPA: type II secretion system protein [Acidimicrobiales bacterium]|nr:type II secretion system protein [Acidimicrobiales bacterium]
MGDCSGHGLRVTRLSRHARPRRRNTRTDGGFTLIEVVIAISLLVVMMVPFAEAYISSLNGTTDSHVKEVAAMLADTALDQARALDATDQQTGAVLLYGRQQAAVQNEWASPEPGTSQILADTAEQWDTNAGDTTATLPISEAQTVGGQKFTTYYYVGTCWESENTATGNNQNSCTDPATPPASDYEMYRVVVDVTWTDLLSGCGTSCYYVTSTLISGATNPSFDTNPVAPYITSNPLATFTMGQAGSFQIVTKGFPPPTYTDQSPPPPESCTPNPANLPTWFNSTAFANQGTLSGTPNATGGAGNAAVPGAYLICVNATNTGPNGQTQYGYQNLALDVIKASPSITVAGPPQVTVGQAIAKTSISATLASGFNESGTISLSANSNSSCTGSPAWTGTGTANGNTAVAPSSGFTPTTAGTYYWYASYPGDSNNNSATSVCGASSTVVNPATPAITVGGPSNGSTGTAITTASLFTATLTSGYSPTGTITWYYIQSSSAPATCGGSGWTSLGTASVSGNSTYSPSSVSITPTSPVTYWWYASYAGDTNNSSAGSTCASHMTVTGNYITTLSASATGSGTVGSAIAASSISATLSNASPSDSGSITFYYIEAASAPSSGCPTGWTQLGTAVAVSGSTPKTYNPSAGFTPTTAGNYWFYASYGGDSNDNASQSACNPVAAEIVVGKATPSVGVNGSLSGSTITYTASVTGGGVTPTGTITWSISVTSGSPPTCSPSSGPLSSGQASCTVTGASSSKKYTATANYGGDSNYNSASGTSNQVTG